MRRLPWMALVFALAALAPASASAATIEVVPDAGGQQVRYVAGPGEFNNVFVQLWQGKVMVQDGYNYGVIQVDAKSPCAAEPQYPAGSPQWSCPATGVNSVYIDLGDEADTLSYGMGAFALPVTVNAGAGNDDLFTRDEFPDTIDCGEGYDHLRSDGDDQAVACERIEGPSSTPERADGKPIGISINGGAAFTNTPDVVVTAFGPDAATMLLLANDGGFAGAGSMPVSALNVYTWRLAETGAERLPKTVYARFTGTGVDASRTFSDDIILDETAPVVTAAHVHGHTLQVGARDTTSGVAALQMRFTQHGRASAFRGFARSTAVKRAPVAVRVRDRAMNVSRWRSVSR